jgi:polar amino acid transport system permease protein
VATYTELLYQTQNIQARTYEVIPLFVMASLWYLLMTTVLTIGQFYVERYYARGSSYALPLTPIQKIRRNLTTLRRTPFSADSQTDSSTGLSAR